MVRPDRPHWGPLPAVAQAIADGEPWLLAWTLHSTTPYRLLARESGVSIQRLDELYRGAAVSMEELAALARVWRVDLKQVLPTLPAGVMVP
jgi:hypothetical protein